MDANFQLGRPEREAEYLAFTTSLAPEYGDDWWFLTHLGWSHTEAGKLGASLVVLHAWWLDSGFELEVVDQAMREEWAERSRAELFANLAQGIVGLLDIALGFFACEGHDPPRPRRHRETA